MIKNILIAAAVKPIEGKNWSDLYRVIQVAALDFNCVVLGGIVTGGPGCINMGLKLHGPNESRINDFGKAVCLSMMPSKWCDTPDEIKDGFVDNLTESY